MPVPIAGMAFKLTAMNLPFCIGKLVCDPAHPPVTFDIRFLAISKGHFRLRSGTATRQGSGLGEMIQYYQESNGDYLAIETSTNSLLHPHFGKDHFEGQSDGY